MGEGNDQEGLITLVQAVKTNFPDIKTALYSGRQYVEGIMYDIFDYVKVGPYMEDYGPLNNPKTNQRLYMCSGQSITDITNKFWEKITL